MIKNNCRSLHTILLVAALLSALTVAPSFALKSLPQVLAVAHGQNVSPAATEVSAPAIEKARLHQALLDLTNPFTVMCVAAHPDDEDGTSLIVMRRKYGAHTVSLFSTFGEGGQNAIGPELYEEMGAIRARETMAASEIQGSEPYFLGLKDFGFSKSAEEAFRFWGHDEALRRMVLQIRKLRPDVIITNHNSTSGHGHHQATGRLELESFEAAADPKRFPEQLKDGVSTWQVQRLFLRVGFGNQQAQQSGGTVTIDPNERDPISGKIFAEEALRGLQQHATQGPWPRTFADMLRFRTSQDGKMPFTRYVLVREAKGAGALPQDSHNFLDGLKLPDSFTTELKMPVIDGKPLVEFVDDRSKVLAELLKSVRTGFRFGSDWSNSQRLSLMRERLGRATAIAAGVSLQVEMPARIVTPGTSVELKLKISNAGDQDLFVAGCNTKLPSLAEPIDPAKVMAGATSILSSLETVNRGSVLPKTLQLLIPARSPINLPLASHLYEPSGLGSAVQTICSVGFGQGITDSFTLEETRNVDVSWPLEITSIKPSPLVITPQTLALSKTLNLEVSNHAKTSVQTAVETIPRSNQTQAPRRLPGTPLSLGPNEKREVKITFPPGETRKGVVLESTRQSLTSPSATQKKPPVAAPSVHLLLRTTNKASNEVAVPVVYADARVAPNLLVGYVRGFDYSLPNALAALGVESKELSVDEVKTADLQKYTTIIVDNRVYESEPELIAANQKLLDYAKDGGTLVVFYHKSNEWNPDERRKRQQLAPYKLILGNERITDETAPITFIEPQHPLLNIPNQMGQEDFADWIQERGLYYPRDWDPQYHALLQSNDPGEAPLKGGLLVADYGRGHYIYTSMVWYRQLRAGVPGAYRMFANMISYGKDGPGKTAAR